MNYPEGASSVRELLKSNPRGMSVTDIAEATGINRNTVSRYLDMLLVSGQAEMNTYGRAKVFYLSQRVPMSAMLDFTKDMVIVLDSGLRIIQINDEVSRFTGKEKDTIIGKEIGSSPLAAFDHPVVRERLEEGIKGSETVEEIRFVRVERETIFRFKIIPTVFEDGSPGVTIILEDITEQKRAEEALRTSEHTYRTLVEEINDVICNVDEDENFCYVSPKITEITGYTPGDLEGKSVGSFLEHGKKKLDLFGDEGSADGEKGRLVRLGFKRKDGNTVPVEASISPIHDIIGDFSGYRLVIRDISEREHSERVLKRWKSFLFSVIENIPSMVMVKSVEEERIVYINKSAEDRLGVKKEFLEDIYVNGKHKSIIPPAINDGGIPVSGDGTQAEGVTAMIEFPGNGPVKVSIKKIPIHGSPGSLKYILIIIDPV